MREMDQFLDFWNLMCYDFAGSWDHKAGHMANVFPARGGGGDVTTPFNADEAVKAYLQGGVHPRKIIFGMPLYGRAFENTDGPGKEFQGVGEGSWENGVWDYKDLPLRGGGGAGREVVDRGLMASWCFDPVERKMVSYDTPEVAGLKVDYIAGMELGGAMWWELSGDHPVQHERSLVRLTGGKLGSIGGLDGLENTLSYPVSRFENLRRGFE